MKQSNIQYSRHSHPSHMQTQLEIFKEWQNKIGLRDKFFGGGLGVKQICPGGKTNCFWGKKQARKSSEDTHFTGYARFEKVWAR